LIPTWVHSFVVQIYFMEQQIKALPRTRRTSQQINDLLTEFDNSGCTVKEFCLLHGMSAGAFHKWQSRYKSISDQKDPSPGFAEVMVRTSSGALFAEVNGIRLYQPVHASFLKELLP
jgi:hypothetical protein